MWFDTHCHLDFPPFAELLPGLLHDFEMAGVNACLVPAVAPNNWARIIALQTRPNLAIALGYHPCFLSNTQLNANPENLETELAILQALVQQHATIISAWGECGLDGRFPEQFEHQDYLFKRQIEMAAVAHLPLVIHSVRLHDQVAQALKQAQFQYGGVIHAFSGSYQQAKRFVDLGFKIGVGGTITWPRAEKTRKALRRLPVESLVLETDAPDMPLYQMNTEFNTPLHLAVIFQHLAAIRSEDSQQLQQALWVNSCALFNLEL